MNQLQGNLLTLAEEGKFDVIVHGCNCFHAMGGGIAAKIAFLYPEVEQADSQTVKGSREKLGNFSHCLVEREGKHSFTVVNAYTQFKWSGFEDVFEYQAFETFLNRLCKFIHPLYLEKGRALNIGFPKIGCGLARGDESRILPMIAKFSKDVHPWASVSVVCLKPEVR
jgi:O-acetyl-ADP-ribose deacetylase (regulator of RNase III)